MLRSSVQTMLQRDIAAVRRSVEAYPDDASLWAEGPGLPNLGGTLALHIAGNLQHYIGAVLGQSGYQRDRDAEFSRRDVPRTVLLAELEAAQQAVECGLTTITEQMLAQPYPEQIAGRTVATGDLLVQLAVHLAYHLGQLDYHRRIVTGERRSIGAVDAAELPEWHQAHMG